MVLLEQGRQGVDVGAGRRRAVIGYGVVAPRVVGVCVEASQERADPMGATAGYGGPDVVGDQD
jgi:hypothetical protein